MTLKAAMTTMNKSPFTSELFYEEENGHDEVFKFGESLEVKNHMSQSEGVSASGTASVSVSVSS